MLSVLPCLGPAAEMMALERVSTELVMLLRLGVVILMCEDAKKTLSHSIKEPSPLSGRRTMMQSPCFVV